MDLLEKPITKLRQLIPRVWGDAEGELEIFKERNVDPLESLMFPPYHLDFLFGPDIDSLGAILMLSEPEGYSDVVERFLMPLQGKKIRVHYALTRKIPTGVVREGQEPLEFIRKSVLDIAFTATLKSWGPKRFSMAQRHSYNILLTNLKDTKLPDFKPQTTN